MSEVRFFAVRSSRALLARIGFSVVFLLSMPCMERGQQGPSVLELVQQFESTRVFWQQFEVAKAIIAMHDASILAKLEPWLTLDDRHLRGNAAFLFAGLGDPRGFEIIAAILNDRSERATGQGAAYFHTGPPDAGPDAKRLLALQIAADRYYAAHLLGDLKDSCAVPILVRLLNDPAVNYIVPWSLGQIGDRSAAQPLIGVLSDRNPDMRVLAIYALEQLRATEALPSLRPLLNDNQRSTFSQQVSVAEAARAAIVELEPRPPAPPQR